MIIVKLMGGVGNQMFQYAAGKRLSIKLDKQLKMDLSYFDLEVLPNGLPPRTFDLGIFNLEIERASQKEIDRFTKNPINIIDRLVKKINSSFSPYQYLYEPHFHFYSEFLEIKNNVYLEGYWQSEKYFKDIEDTIRSDFELDPQYLVPGKVCLDEINNSNSICLNIRRQEFASKKYPTQFVGKEYLNSAVEWMNSNVINAHFYIFSDDLDWVRSSLKLKVPHTIVGDEYYGYKYSTYFGLMSACKHFIIPNSAFAWWAAYLSENNDKIVVVPKNWFNDSKINTSDLIPKSWNQL